MDEHTPHNDDLLPQPADPVPDDAPPVVSSLYDPGAPIPGVLYQPPPFEDLTLSEALGYVLRRPSMLRRLWRVLVGAEKRTIPTAPDRPDQTDHEDHPDDGAVTVEDAGAWLRESAQLWLSIAVLLLAVVMAVHGGWKLHNATLDPLKHLTFDTGDAALWFELAGVLVVAWALYEGRGWWAAQFARVTSWLPKRTHATGEARPWQGGVAFLALITVIWGLMIAEDWRTTALLMLVGAALWLSVLASTAAPREAPETAGPADAAAVPAADQDNGSWLRRSVETVRGWMFANTLQVVFIPAAVVLSLLTYSENVNVGADGAVFDVVITTNGAWAWLLSVIAWIVVLGVDVRRVPERVQRWSRVKVDGAGLLRSVVRRIDWPLIALVLIIAVGAWFRTMDLSDTPPEMTSDHIEKLLDSVKVHDGYYAVFFPNNGGREAFQMYFVEFIADELGVGFNFDALKWATVIEGVLTLPAVWWMAQQVIGTHTADRRRLGRWVGVGMAGLLALSSWHLMLSRLGLRIALTPLTTALVIGFLARAMRYDRTRDWLALGVTLGAGIYFYQANRMLPLVVIAGTGLALLMRVRTWRDALRTVSVGLIVTVVALGPLALLAALGETSQDVLPFMAAAWWAGIALVLRGGRSAIHPYVGSVSTILGGVLGTAVIALAIAIPMLHYIGLYPDQFWNRTRGRLYGENAFVRPNDDGVLVSYDPTVREQWDRFWDQRDVFEDNYADALRMYHWEGDAGWISNPNGYPALGAVMGGLLILGMILSVVWVLRERDWVLLLLPASVLIMLLPSALTLAYTIENPSFTRASGTIPPIFMLAGLPLGLLFARLSQIPWRVPIGGAAALVILAGVWHSAYDWNYEVFYTDYHISYSRSWKPYREISKPLRAFAEGEGSFGNAFVVAYPHWLDHRVLGAMAGDIRWPNGLVDREQLIPMVLRNQGTPYKYDPDKPLFVMVHTDDPETLTYLEEMFPGGTAELYEYEWETGPHDTSHGQFYIYRVEAGALAGAG